MSPSTNGRRGLYSAAFSFVQLLDRQSFRLLEAGSKPRERRARGPGSCAQKWARQGDAACRQRHGANHAEALTCG